MRAPSERTTPKEKSEMRTISDELAERLTDGPVLDATCKREVANSVLHILESVGEDPDRDGLTNTPERVARMYEGGRHASIPEARGGCP